VRLPVGCFVRGAVIKDVTKQTFSVTLSKAKGLYVKILRFAQNDKYLFRYNSIASSTRNLMSTMRFRVKHGMTDHIKI